MLAEVNQIDLIYREGSEKVLATPPPKKRLVYNQIMDNPKWKYRNFDFIIHLAGKLPKVWC